MYNVQPARDGSYSNCTVYNLREGATLLSEKVSQRNINFRLFRWQWNRREDSGSSFLSASRRLTLDFAFFLIKVFSFCALLTALSVSHEFLFACLLRCLVIPSSLTKTRPNTHQCVHVAHYLTRLLYSCKYSNSRWYDLAVEAGEPAYGGHDRWSIAI